MAVDWRTDKYHTLLPFRLRPGFRRVCVDERKNLDILHLPGNMVYPLDYFFPAKDGNFNIHVFRPPVLTSAH